MMHDVRTFGAVGDGKTKDHLAIRRDFCLPASPVAQHRLPQLFEL